MTKERAKRYNSGKPSLDLLPLDMLTGLARVLEMGEKKYGRNNWRKGAPATEQVASLLRHLQPIMEALNTDLDPSKGRDFLFDAESGLPHVDHMLFNVISLRLALESEYRLPRDPVLNKTVDAHGNEC